MQTAEVNLPENILEQGRKAFEMQKQLAGETVPAATPTEPVQAPQATPQAPTEPTPQLQPPQEIVPLNPEIPQPPVQQPQPAEDYKAKYEEATAQFGNLNTQFQAVQRQLSDLQSDYFQVKNQNNELVEKLNNVPAQQPQEPAKVGKLDPESFGNYGPEFAEMAKMLNSVMDMQQQNVQPQPQAPAPVPQVDNDRLSYERVRDSIRNYDVINHDAGFINWLNQNNPYTGMPRMVTLQDADGKMDLATVKGIFAEFETSGLFQPVQQNSQLPPEPPPAPPQDQNLAPPQAPVQPPISPSPAPSMDANFVPTPQGRIYDKATVNDFYKKVALGEYAGHEKWVEETQADIFRAGPEGRIRP